MQQSGQRSEILRAVNELAYARSVFFRHYHSAAQVDMCLDNEARMIAILERTMDMASIVRVLNTLIPGAMAGAAAGAAAGVPAGFWDTVPVALTNAQMTAALQPHTPPAENNNELCCICQYSLAAQPACELARCHHHLHRACAEQWFSMSTRCPVCRASAAT
uniref:RING-type E3 ubiquitin transferase n=1 Tax=viral metagenome TaxID=1070528 RepID=A0A6C0KAB0_9ZZZZ